MKRKIREIFALDRDAYRERMFLKGLMLVATAWFLGVFLWVSLQRMGFPFEIGVMESTAAETSARILEGNSIYTEISPEWVPTKYTPLYYYVCAVLMRIFSVSLPMLRIVSLVSTIGIGIVFYRFLRRTGVEDFFSLAAVGLFFAAYSVLGNYYDLAQTDTFAAFLALTAILFSARGQKMINIVLSAVFVILAVFSKQSYLIVWILLMAHWYYHNKKFLLYFVEVSGLLLIAGLFYLHVTSDGHFWLYTVVMPLKGDVLFMRLLTFWVLDVFWKFPFISLVSAASIFGLGRILLIGKVKESDSAMMVMVAGFVIVALMNRLQVGELETGLLPAALAIAGLTSWSLQHFHVNEYGLGWIPSIIVKSLVIFEFITLIYNPKPQMANLSDIDAGKRMIKTISEIPGDVLIPDHPFYGRMAGKETFFSASNLYQLMTFEEGKKGDYLPPVIKSSIEERRYDAIIIDEPIDSWLMIIAPYYRMSDRIFENPNALMTVAGERSRPQFIYLPQ